MSELYDIIDPRPFAASNPYTFLLPSKPEIDAIENGDLIKLVVRSIPPSELYDAERLWIKVTSKDGNWIEGTTENEPLDMPSLPKGSIIRADRTHIADILFANSEREAALAVEPRREYWDRCLSDKVVLDGTHKVQYIYREAPETLGNGDEFPDSGWRIRGDMRHASEQEIAEREAVYIAIGAVLNKDDSWLAFIDEPVGSAFERDFESNVFVRVS